MRILFHKLFGWNYIAFRFGGGEVIRKVKVWPSGIKTVSYYREIAYLNEDSKTLSTGRYYIELT